MYSLSVRTRVHVCVGGGDEGRGRGGSFLGRHPHLLLLLPPPSGTSFLGPGLLFFTLATTTVGSELQ